MSIDDKKNGIINKQQAQASGTKPNTEINKQPVEKQPVTNSNVKGQTPTASSNTGGQKPALKTNASAQTPSKKPTANANDSSSTVGQKPALKTNASAQTPSKKPTANANDSSSTVGQKPALKTNASAQAPSKKPTTNANDVSSTVGQKPAPTAKTQEQTPINNPRSLKNPLGAILGGQTLFESSEDKKRKLIVDQQDMPASLNGINIDKTNNSPREGRKLESIVDQQDRKLFVPVYNSPPSDVDPKKLEALIKQQAEVKRAQQAEAKQQAIANQQAEARRQAEAKRQAQINQRANMLNQDQNVEQPRTNSLMDNAQKRLSAIKSKIFVPKSVEEKAANGETVVFSENMKETLQGVDAKQNTQEIPIIGGKKTKKSFFTTRTKKPNFVVGVILNTVYLSFIAIILVGAIGIGTVMGVANAYLETTPILDTQKIEDQEQTSLILDQEGHELHTYAGTENRELASIDEIPINLQNAVIAVEDVRFRKHQGVDFRRLVGAFFSNVSSGTSEGGSTITQQLVKNKLLSNERSYKRKLQEAALAMELEKRYTKEQILESYLNTIPLGGLVYGVKTAAKDYFDKDLSELTLKEIACIAAITQNPHKFNPRSATYTAKTTDNLEDLINRMNMVLERMLWNDMITQEEYDANVTPKEVYTADGYRDVWKAEMNILPESPANALYEAPHFIEYVIYDVQNALMRKEGLEDTQANRNAVDKKMRSEGYSIYSTYDKQIQDILQNTISDWDDYPSFGNKKYNTTTMKDKAGNITEVSQPQAAAVVIEVSTGYLRGIVGSRYTPTSMRTLNRAYQGQMPVGSSIKPLSVYGPVFDIGYGPGSGVANLKVPITGWESEEGYPTTSTGEIGCVPLRRAIVGSWNIAAGRTLMDYVTVETSVEYLKKLGVDEDSIIETPVGLSMGGSPITPIEMAGGYATIARGGTYSAPVSFTKVIDSKGNTIIDNTDTGTDRVTNEAFKPSTAWLITDVLVEAVKVGTGKRARLENITTAGKTGTIVDNKGVFFAGYTPYYVSSLWVGHDEYKGFVSGTAASNATAPLWKSYMTQIHEAKGKTEDKPIIAGEPEDFNLVKQAVCGISNKLPSGSCSSSTIFTDYYYAPDIPLENCDECSGGGASYEICGISGMQFVHGVCPADQYATRSTRRYKEGSVYNQGSSSSGPPAPCNYAHNPWPDIPVEVVPEPVPEVPVV